MQIASMIVGCEYVLLGDGCAFADGEIPTGELFPLKVRAKCLSITTATNWLL
jgi:hypothetical protein